MTQITLCRAGTRLGVATLGGVLVAGSLLGATGATGASAAPAANAPRVVTITDLSGRADLVTGGSTLLRVSLPAGATGLRVTVAPAGGSVPARDVTPSFGTADDGTIEGLVTGLTPGQHIVTAAVDGGRGARLTVTDHPIGGPVFSGPQILPWACQAGATDAQCDGPTVTTYRYLPVGVPNTSGGGTGGTSYTTPFQTYDPANPPPAAGIARTTTDTGVTVPFVIRTDVGYSDRDQWQTSVLYQPGLPWTPLREQPQWNQKLVLTHGASCDTTYGAGTANDTKGGVLLGHGYVLASHALDNAGHNCNIATEAESLIMVKEQVAKTYGAIKWTIGSGCSGGSLVQQQVANAYPGVYQAITPACSFTDAWSSAMEYEDYVMILAFLKDTSRSGTDAYGPTQIQSIIDHPNPANPATFTTAIPNSGDAERSCPSVPASIGSYSADNPNGVKCSLQQYEANLLGVKDDGFANRPFDNVGIQYGFNGLVDGTLSPQQFADLNAKIGGFDEAGQVETTSRVTADQAGLDRVYSTGLVDTASNLNQVAIIDLRGPDNGTFHDVYRTYALRDRLLRNFGTAANQVLWRGQVDLFGDVNYADQAVIAADTWVAAYEADTRDVPLSQKIIEDKPQALTDRCTDGAGTAAPTTSCDATVLAYGTPRFAAGEPSTDDVLKCQLTPLNRADYPVSFTDAQWAELVSAFPSGVCDYRKPGVDQPATTTPWLTYAAADGSDVVGGTPMGAEPVSVPFGPDDAGATPSLAESPVALLLPLAMLGLVGAALVRRRHAVRG